MVESILFIDVCKSQVSILLQISNFKFQSIKTNSLYFYETLKQKEEDSGGDLKSFNTLLSKSEINFVSLIEIFVGKSEVYNFSLILQADKLTAVSVMINKSGFKTNNIKQQKQIGKIFKKWI